MSTNWYYSANGRQVGPVSEREIRALAASGRINAADLVWQTGQSTWIPAASVPGLFPGPPPLPPTSRTHPKAAGNKTWLVLGIVGGVLLLIFVSLQSMINSHNRRRQEAIDFNRNELQQSLDRLRQSFEELDRRRGKR